MPWRYQEEILQELRRHGVVPRPDTDPQSVRDFVSGLYRYEIRQLKARLKRREFPRAEYAARVVELRSRYIVLSIPLPMWVHPEGPR